MFWDLYPAPCTHFRIRTANANVFEGWRDADGTWTVLFPGDELREFPSEQSARTSINRAIKRLEERELEEEI